MYQYNKPYTHRMEYNPTSGMAKVRFFHFSPNAPKVDITLPDGTMLFSDIGYGEYTDYITVTPGIYTLQVRPAGQKDVVLSVPNVSLTPNSKNSVYATGLLGGNPPLNAALISD